MIYSEPTLIQLIVQPSRSCDYKIQKQNIKIATSCLKSIDFYVCTVM